MHDCYVGRDKGRETRKQQVETKGYKEMGNKGGSSWAPNGTKSWVAKKGRRGGNGWAPRDARSWDIKEGLGRSR